MKAFKRYGNCKLCGELKGLTFEHVPPKSAFNSVPVIYYSFNEVIKEFDGENVVRMPWDFTGLKGQKQQHGVGGYYLCNTCNNNTGSWYIREYTEMAHIINHMLQTQRVPVNSYCSFRLLNRYSLRLFKAIMTLFCDINDDCLGNKDLRAFLMNKEAEGFSNHIYEVYMHLVSPSMKKINAISAVGSIYGGTTIVTEIASYPIGITLYIDRYDGHDPFGVNITEWSQFSYDDKCDIDFIGIPYIELNSQYPMDYRTKEEIEKCVKQNVDKIKNNALKT